MPKKLNMNKPTIFFSHSSKDKKILTSIKNHLLKITSNTIKIFQSSDGESIPFGNNWVHKIEENLKVSKLMFVFVTPNSIKSNWLYFESGFSYSKGVKVIPIGLNGIDVGQIGPPINLLQGFNINSHEGLNNIVSIINKEFETNYGNDFQKQDYSNIIQLAEGTSGYLNRNYFINYIFTNFGKMKNETIIDSPYETIKSNIEQKKIHHSIVNNEIYLNGMSILKEDFQRFHIRIDEINLKENIEIINSIAQEIYDPPLEIFWLSIKFYENIELLTTNFKLSSRLNLIGIKMTEENGDLYYFKSLRFGLFPHAEYREEQLRIVYVIEKINYEDIFELIEILFENNILLKK